MFNLSKNKKEKKSKPYKGKFFVKQFTSASRQNGTTGDFSQSVQVVNSDKPYPEIRLGFGWDIYFETLGMRGFNAVPHEASEDDKPLDEVDNLTNITLKKKWLHKRNR